MNELKDLWTEGTIRPFDRITTFDISELESAMTLFSKGLHTGKVVITYQNSEAILKVRIFVSIVCESTLTDYAR